MPAAKTRGLSPGATLGILAGGGVLPGMLAAACERQGIPTFIVAFKSHTDPALYQNRPHLLTRPGRAGFIFRTLREMGILDIIMIGALRRPSLLELRPDWRTAKFYANVARRALGDDGFLRAVRAEIEKDGFRIYGMQDFMPDILGPAGPLGKLVPDDADWADIRLGVEESQRLGRLDI